MFCLPTSSALCTKTTYYQLMTISFQCGCDRQGTRRREKERTFLGREAGAAPLPGKDLGRWAQQLPVRMLTPKASVCPLEDVVPSKFPCWCLVQNKSLETGLQTIWLSKEPRKQSSLVGRWGLIFSWRGCRKKWTFSHPHSILMRELEPRNIHPTLLPLTRRLPFLGASKRPWAPLAIEIPTLQANMSQVASASAALCQGSL